MIKKRLTVIFLMSMLGCKPKLFPRPFNFGFTPFVSYTKTCSVVRCNGYTEYASNGPQYCEWFCGFYNGGFHEVNMIFYLDSNGCFVDPVVTTDSCVAP